MVPLLRGGSGEELIKKMIRAFLVCKTVESRLVEGVSKDFGCSNAATVVEMKF